MHGTELVCMAAWVFCALYYVNIHLARGWSSIRWWPRTTRQSWRGTTALGTWRCTEQTAGSDYTPTLSPSGKKGATKIIPVTKKALKSATKTRRRIDDPVSVRARMSSEEQLREEAKYRQQEQKRRLKARTKTGYCASSRLEIQRVVQ